MLTTVLAHPGLPPAPHDLPAWRPDSLVVVGLVVLGVLYRRGWVAVRGRAGVERWRWGSFLAGTVTLAVALASPLEPVADALASAHMVQHLLLTLVAAPLLAAAAPFTTLLWSAPRSVRKRIAVHRRRLAAPASGLRRPGVVWLLHVGALWVWHAARVYEAALHHPLVHVVQHASFLLTAIGFWWVVLRLARHGEAGLGVLLVFTMGLQGVVLAALLSFAPTPWYGSYAGSAPGWGLDPLSDQQLAGMLMWFPSSLVYLAAALALLVVWMRPASPGHGRATGRSGGEAVAQDPHDLVEDPPHPR